MRIENGGPYIGHECLVLFPFDTHSLPYQNGVELKLHGHTAPCGTTPRVLEPGSPGDPDSLRAIYYGSVHRVGNQLYMWYLGQDHDQGWFSRVCLATSRDGYTWHKPDLGLVEYKGSRRNNLVDLHQGHVHVQSCVVFHDPDDPDPARRFKMVYQTRIYDWRFAVAFSADGMSWTPHPDNPVGYWLEMAGGMRFNDCYFLTGQGGNHARRLRNLVTYSSYDFEDWSSASVLGMQRSGGDRLFHEWQGTAGKQIHLGAALWNRNNVMLGFYGMWNGHPSNDRRLVVMHLGLAVTNDGLHYREPIPDYPIVSAAEDGWEVLPDTRTSDNYPSLIQGQGFENIGEETLFWYAPWPEQASDGIRVASWPRDRLGSFKPYLDQRMASRGDSHVISAPIDLEGRPARLSLNVDGQGEHWQVRCSVLDERMCPLPGFAAADCRPVAAGLAEPVTWADGLDAIPPTEGRIRLRVDFGGIRPEDASLYALYLEGPISMTRRRM